MSEIHFIAEESAEGGYIARAVGVDIFTAADDLPSLHDQVRDAVRCHFAADQKPAVIRLHITREEALAECPVTSCCKTCSVDGGRS